MFFTNSSFFKAFLLVFLAAASTYVPLSPPSNSRSPSNNSPPTIKANANSAIQSGLTTWRPYGPHTSQVNITDYGSSAAMFSAFASGKIDITDLPISPSDLSSICSPTTNPDFFCSSPTSELGLSQLDINHARAFLGVNQLQARTTAPVSVSVTAGPTGCFTGFGSVSVQLQNQETNAVDQLFVTNNMTLTQVLSGGVLAGVTILSGAGGTGRYNFPCVIAGNYLLGNSAYMNCASTNIVPCTVLIGSATTNTAVFHSNFNSASNKLYTQAGTYARQAIRHLLDKPQFVLGSTLQGQAQCTDIYAAVPQGFVNGFCSTVPGFSSNPLPADVLKAECPALLSVDPTLACNPIDAYLLNQTAIGQTSVWWGTTGAVADNGYPSIQDVRAACDLFVLAGFPVTPGGNTCIDVASAAQGIATRASYPHNALPSGQQIIFYITNTNSMKAMGQIVADGLNLIFGTANNGAASGGTVCAINYGSNSPAQGCSPAYYGLSQVSGFIFGDGLNAQTWNLYTGSENFGLNPDNEYSAFNSAFASDYCGGAQSAVISNYDVACDPKLDAYTNAAEFQGTSQGTTPAFNHALTNFQNATYVSTMDVSANPVYSRVEQFVALNSWNFNPGTEASLVNGFGTGWSAGTVGSYFTLLNAHCNSAYVTSNNVLGCGGGNLDLIRQGESQDTINLSPYRATSPWDYQLINMVWDSMLKVNPESVGPLIQLINWMITSHTSSFNPSEISCSPGRGCVAGTTTQLWHLRPDLQFHDGFAVTADDVCFSILSYRDVPAALLQPTVNNVATCAVLTSSTVQVKLGLDGPFYDDQIGSIPILPHHTWAIACNWPVGAPEPSLAVLGSSQCGNPSFDPMASGLMIGSGPWMCNTNGGVNGGPCTSTGTQQVTVGGTIALSRHEGFVRCCPNVQGTSLQKFSWADRFDTGRVTIADLADAALRFKNNDAYWADPIYSSSPPTCSATGVLGPSGGPGTGNLQCVDIGDISTIALYKGIGLTDPLPIGSAVGLDPSLDPFEFTISNTNVAYYQSYASDTGVLILDQFANASVTYTGMTFDSSGTLLSADNLTSSTPGAVAVNLAPLVPGARVAVGVRAAPGAANKNVKVRIPGKPIITSFNLPNPNNVQCMAGTGCVLNGRAMAFDGKNLWYTFDATRTGDTRIYEITPTGQLIKVFNLAPTLAPGSLAWDSTRKIFWAGAYDGGVNAGSGKIFTFDPSAAVPTLRDAGNILATTQGDPRNPFPGHIDGLAYDWFNDVLWVSTDEARVYYKVPFNIGSPPTINPAAMTPFDTPPDPANPANHLYNSGIAFDGTQLWLALFKGIDTQPYYFFRLRTFDQAVTQQLLLSPNNILGAYQPEGLHLDFVTFPGRTTLWTNEATTTIPRAVAWNIGPLTAPRGIWTSVGPSPISTCSAANEGTIANCTGRVTAIAVDPSDITGKTIYLGGAQGGVWKTVNGGLNWSPKTDDQPTLAIGSIAVDPNGVVYVGTGEGNGCADSLYGAGVLKSTDGGATWSQLGASTFLRSSITKILVNGNNVIASTRKGCLSSGTGPSAVVDPGVMLGVYTSSDGGLTWVPAQGILAATQAGWDMVQDPTAPAIMYAAVDSAIYVSVNSGANWAALPAAAGDPLTAGGVGRISLGISKASPNDLYVGMDILGTGSLWKVTVRPVVAWLPVIGLRPDPKLTFVPSPGPPGPGVLWNNGNTVIYDTNGDGIYNAGDIVISGPAPAVGTMLCGSSVPLNTCNDPNIKYIETAGDATWDGSQFNPSWSLSPFNGRESVVYDGEAGGGNGLYDRSDILIAPRDINGNFVGSFFCGKQCSYDQFIAVDPQNVNVLYLGGLDVYRSTDAGTTWTDLGGGNGFNQYIHTDQHAFAFDPTSHSGAYVGNDGGIWTSATLDTCAPAACWTDRNQGLTLTQFQSLATHPTEATLFFGGTQDNGAPQHSDNSVIWNGVGFLLPDNNRIQGDGGWTAYDPTNATIMYRTFANISPLRSMDSGVHWTEITNGLQNDQSLFYPPMAMDQTAPSTLYLGSFRLYKTVNRGDQWNVLWTFPGNVGLNCARGSGVACTRLSAIALAPSNPQILYVGTDTGRLWVGRSDGTSFVDKTANLPPSLHITKIAIDPANPNIVYITSSGFGGAHIFRTDNGGTIWIDIGSLPDVPADVIVVRRGIVYVGTDLGVFVSADRGSSWSKLGTGLPSVAVYDLVFAANGTLLAATHGRGVWAFTAL